MYDHFLVEHYNHFPNSLTSSVQSSWRSVQALDWGLSAQPSVHLKSLPITGSIDNNTQESKFLERHGY